MNLTGFLFLILDLIQWILYAYLAFGTVYIFIFSMAGHWHKKNTMRQMLDYQRIVVLIPGYKEDQVIIEAAKEALLQDYPREKFEVVIIADSFQPATLEKLLVLPLRVIPVSFDKSTKAKALNKAMEIIPDDQFDIALVLDADNIMAKDFLNRINRSMTGTMFGIQGHRIAKNTNTPFAVLDAVSEEINNHIFRKGHRVLRLSSSLIGSGMAFPYAPFKALMTQIKAIGGFDKEIELTLLRERKTIGYLEDALIFDEKVQASDVFVKQRRRWLSAQLHYARYFTDSLWQLLAEGNTDYFDKAVQMLLPPRILLMGLIPIMTLLSFWVNPFQYTTLWLLLLFLLVSALLLAVPRKFYNTSTLHAVLYLPKGFLLMLVSLFTTRGANKKFIHTQHTSTQNPVDH